MSARPGRRRSTARRPRPKDADDERHPVPLHRRAGRARSSCAGRTGGRARAPSTPQPGRPAGRPRRGRRAGQKLFVLDMFPYPSRRRACTSATRWATSAPTCYGRYQRMTGKQRAARAGLRRVRPARRAVRRADRPAPAHDHRGQHRHDAAPAAPAGPGPRRPPQRRHHRRRTSTAGRSGSSCRSSTPGTTSRPTAGAAAPADRRAGRRSSESGERADAGRPAVGRADRRPSGAR